MTKPATVTELNQGAAEIAEEAPMLHPTLAPALVAALSDLMVVEKGQTATIPMKSGGTFSYGYADLADIVKRTRPVLAHHGIIALTPLGAHGEGLSCSVVLLHQGGESMTFGPFPFPHGRDAQATGSMVTYMRRYALVAALGMAAGDDDDGAAAQPRQPAPAVMSLEDAKAHVLSLCDGNRELAKPAWVALFETPWTKEALSAAFDVWVHLPADEVPDA